MLENISLSSFLVPDWLLRLGLEAQGGGWSPRGGSAHGAHGNGRVWGTHTHTRTHTHAPSPCLSLTPLLEEAVRMARMAMAVYE
eukprot:9239368-Pyramimonas_sp.AAC.1